MPQLAGNYVGKELLVRHIIREGIFSLLAGEHPRMIGIKLAAFLGESYLETVEKEFNFNEAEVIQKLQDFLDNLKDLPPLSNATALLEEPLGKLDDRSLPRLLAALGIPWKLISWPAITGAKNF